MYAGIVDPLGTLFNPAYFVSHIIAHQGYNNLTRRNDIALMRLSKPVDKTGAYKKISYHYIRTQLNESHLNTLALKSISFGDETSK